MLYWKFVIGSAYCTHLMIQCRTLSSRILSRSWHVLPICDPGLPATTTPLHVQGYMSANSIVTFCIIWEPLPLQRGLFYTSTNIVEIKKTIQYKKTDNHHGKFLGTTSIHILGSHTSLALTLVGLRPS